jgi:hypothetical protein
VLSVSFLSEPWTWGAIQLIDSTMGLNSNKGTKSDIEIAPAERALDRFSSCFFEPVVQIGSGRAVATANKLLAGAVSRQALDLRTIEALLQVVANGPGSFVATCLNDLRHLVGIKLPKLAA